MSIIVLPIYMESIPTKNYIYIVYDSEYRQAIIIDPNGDLKLIQDSISKFNLTLKAILITHTHFDHIGLVVPLVEQYQCCVWVSIEEYKAISIDEQRLIKINSDNYFIAAEMKVTPILTPGHTTGCICYRIGDNLFTGDTLFIEGCGMCKDKSSDPSLLYSSLNKLKNCISNETRIFPGHSYKYTPGKKFNFVLKNNIYLQFSKEQRELFISFRMRKLQTSLYNFK